MFPKKELRVDEMRQSIVVVTSCTVIFPLRTGTTSLSGHLPYIPTNTLPADFCMPGSYTQGSYFTQTSSEVPFSLRLGLATLVLSYVSDLRGSLDASVQESPLCIPAKWLASWLAHFHEWGTHHPWRQPTLFQEGQ